MPDLKGFMHEVNILMLDTFVSISNMTNERDCLLSSFQILTVIKVSLTQRWKKPGLLDSGRPARLTSRGKISRSREKFLRSRGITLLLRQHITFFEPLVQPFEHFKHSNTA